MRIPNPIATTTTEAYLAYKAGVLAQADLKEKLYHPYIHIDGWLAYWTGLTDTYPTDKNGDPECLTDEEAYIAYLAGATSEYPEALKDPADPRMAGYLKYLISARFGRPNYPVTREELYLSMMKPPVVPSGDPSSSIDLEGTVEAPFIDIKAYGDTSQTTYTGKNLLKLFGRTVSGVTGTVNADGSYTISGTGTVTDGVSVFGFNGVLPAGTYTLSLSRALPKVINLFLESGVALRVPAGSTSATVTTTKEYTSASVFFGIENGATYDETFNMQLVAGDTPDYDFEPYVGGIPAPNTDYPQAVQTVTGRQVVAVTGGEGESAEYEINLGKNLINNNNPDLVAGTANWTPTDTGGRISNSITWGDGVQWRFEDLSVGKKYTLHAEVGVAKCYLYVRTYTDSSFSTVKTRLVSDATGNVTRTITLDSPYVGIALLNNITMDNVEIKNFQFELGDAFTGYAPYFGPIELCKIRGYQDYIYRDGEDWFIRKCVKKVVLDGADSGILQWKIASPQSGGWIKFDATCSNMMNHQQPVVCSHFKYLNQDNSSSGIEHIYTFYGASGFNVWVKTTLASDMEGWRAWLAQNKPVLYYKLLEPVDIEIYDTRLIDQLNALMEGGSYDGETHIRISTTDPNLPALLKVEAGKA